MPNDAKLGLVVGVGLVIAVAVLFFRKDMSVGSPNGEPAPAGIVRPMLPSSRRRTRCAPRWPTRRPGRRRRRSRRPESAGTPCATATRCSACRGSITATPNNSASSTGRIAACCNRPTRCRSAPSWSSRTRRGRTQSRKKPAGVRCYGPRGNSFVRPRAPHKPEAQAKERRSLRLRFRLVCSQCGIVAEFVVARTLRLFSAFSALKSAFPHASSRRSVKTVISGGTLKRMCRRWPRPRLM